jgi:anaerobic selenocysteine-containing dehydrogenase
VDSKGELVKVEGNPEDPRGQGRMCSKGRAALRILYHKERNNYPVKRVGERGEGKWQRITWDEAMKTISEKIFQYRKEVGPESIVFGQGTGRGTNQWCQRLGMSNGVNHWCCPAHVCLLPIMTTQFSTLGSFVFWDGSDFDNSECIVWWGANMNWTEATFAAGESSRSRDRNCKTIVIDPCYDHPIAAKADVFLGVRPGSDIALAMAWLNIIIEERLYDDFVCRHHTTLPVLIYPENCNPVYEGDIVDGGDPKKLMVWDEKTSSPKTLSDKDVVPALDHQGFITITLKNGEKAELITAWTELRKRAAEMPAERAAEICWLEPDQIKKAARMYATAKCASIAVMQGVEEHTNTRMALHAITAILVMTGNIDKRGGNCIHPFWAEMVGDYLVGAPTDYHWQHKLGNPEENRFYPVSHPKGVWNAILTGEPYQVKAYITIQGNPVSWSENPDRVVEAFKKIDFLVVMDYFMSPTAQLADIVLPSAHWTERDYIADEFCQEWLYAQQRAVDPLFERRSDITFMRELGHIINPDKWPWETDEELFDFQLKPFGITWQDLKEKWVHTAYPYQEKKYLTNGFDTPTRKAEIYSTVFGQGSDPLFKYVEPMESPYSTPEVAKEYPLILSSGRRYPNFYHSAYRGIAELRELQPHPYITLNSETAATLGIKEHDDVWVESPRGRVIMKARPRESVHPRVVMAPHGWWQGCPDLNLPDYPNNIANINVLISDQAYDPDIGASGMRSSLCKVYKVGEA